MIDFLPVFARERSFSWRKIKLYLLYVYTHSILLSETNSCPNLLTFHAVSYNENYFGDLQDDPPTSYRESNIKCVNTKIIFITAILKILCCGFYHKRICLSFLFSVTLANIPPSLLYLRLKGASHFQFINIDSDNFSELNIRECHHLKSVRIKSPMSFCVFKGIPNLQQLKIESKVSNSCIFQCNNANECRFN